MSREKSIKEFGKKLTKVSLPKSAKWLSVLLVPIFAFAPLCWADQASDHYDQMLTEAQVSGARVEIDEDQNEVFEAVQQGKIQSFSELYKTVESQLHGRVIKVELEEDDEEWIYELKLMHDSNVINVEYDATTLEMIELKGRNLHEVIKK